MRWAMETTINDGTEGLAPQARMHIALDKTRIQRCVILKKKKKGIQRYVRSQCPMVAVLGWADRHLSCVLMLDMQLGTQSRYRSRIVRVHACMHGPSNVMKNRYYIFMHVIFF